MTAEAKKGFADKLHMELVPVEGIRADARALDYGAYTKGYGPNSWRRTAEAGDFAWSVAWGALLRHGTAWFGGEDFDPESGLHHLDHVGANLKFLQTFVAESIGRDDRPTTLAAEAYAVRRLREVQDDLECAYADACHPIHAWTCAEPTDEAITYDGFMGWLKRWLP